MVFFSAKLSIYSFQHTSRKYHATMFRPEIVVPGPLRPLLPEKGAFFKCPHNKGATAWHCTTTRDVWIIPSFRIWGYVLYVEHISCVIINCGQHQWVIPSPRSIDLYGNLGHAEGKHYLKITISIFIVILKNFALLGCFPYILFYRYLFSLLSSVWFVIEVCGPILVRELQWQVNFLCFFFH